MNTWEVYPLGVLCDVVGGVTKDAKRIGMGLQEVPYLRVANVQRLSLSLDDVRTILASESDIASLSLQAGDLLLNEGGDRDKLGRGWIWEGQIPRCIHQNHVFRARIKDSRVTPRWLAYFTNSEAAQSYFFKSGKQTTNLASISSRNLKALPVPVPPQAEQQRIVAAIETHFSRLDAAVASLERASANLKRARVTVLKAAVEGRLVPTEAALSRSAGRDYEPASELLAHVLNERCKGSTKNGGRGKYKEPTKPNKESLEDLPNGWAWASFDQIGEWSSGGTPSRVRGDYFGGAIPWIKTGELVDRNIISSDETITEAGLANSSAKIFPENTLLVAMYGATIGMTGCLRLAAATNQACAALLPSDANVAILPYIWKYIISQRGAFRQIGKGGAQPNISQSILRGWPLPLPPSAEQVRIVAEVDRRLSVLDTLEITTNANLARCTRLRQSILRHAFQGRLVPPEPVTALSPENTST